MALAAAVMRVPCQTASTLSELRRAADRAGSRWTLHENYCRFVLLSAPYG